MIKQLEADNIHEVYQIFKSVIKRMSELGIDQWDDVYPNIEVLTKDIDSKNAYGYFIDDELVAYIALDDTFDDAYNNLEWMLSDQEYLTIHRMAVSPLQQGKRIAKKLVEFAEFLTREKKYRGIRLDAFLDNPYALKLYENNGYSYVGKVMLRKGMFNCYEKIV